ncbi:MAG: hypothetical protein ACYCZX_02450 [Rhodospirillaceae bacterium]
MDWSDKLNAVKFSFDDAWRFHGALAEEDEQPNDAESALAFSLKFFKGNRPRAIAFALRMDAFVDLFATDERMMAWTLPMQGDGSAALQEPVFAAIAGCPLRLVEGKMRFNGDMFFNIVLQNAFQAGAA